MKKILLFAAAAMVAVSAIAEDKTPIYEIDYSKTNWNFYVMGCVPEVVDGVLTSVPGMDEWKYVDGKLEKTGEKLGWYQYFIADGFKTVDGESYTAVIECKASEKSELELTLGWGWGNGESQTQKITMSEDWGEVVQKYEKVGAPAENASSNLVLKPGMCQAKIEVKTVKLYLGDAPTTAVETIAPVKANTAVYNMQGVKVANSIDEVAAPGLYISNGKKVVKK